MSKSTVYGFDSYRSFLSAEINKIKISRKNFSIRAMAKHLNIGSTTLIEVLAGKKNLSLDLGYKICEKLKLSLDETHYFLQLVMLDLAKDEKTKKFFTSKIKYEKRAQQLKRSKISENQNQVLTLKNAMILSLSSTFEEISEEQMAPILKLTLDDTKVSLEKLVQLKLLKKNENNQFISEQKDYLVEDKNKNLSLLRYHTEVLNKTLESLQRDDPSDRAIGSEVLTFSSHKIPAANEIINSCLDKLVELSSSIPRNEVDSIFLLGCQFTRLGRIKK